MLDFVIFKDNYFAVAGDIPEALLNIYSLSDVRSVNPLTPIFVLIFGTENISGECIIINHDKSIIGYADYNRFFFIDASKGMLELKVLSILNGI